MSTGDEDLELDSLVVGGVRFPGKVTLSGHDRGEKWDIKEADGNAGASTTHKGDEVAKFRATFALVIGERYGVPLDEIAEWDAIAVPVLRSLTGGKSPVALDVYHPDLARNDIGSVVKAKVGGLVRDGKGGAVVWVDFLEYKPPKSKAGSPSGSKTKSGATTTNAAGGTSTGAPDPNASAKAELAALVAEASAP